MAPSEAAGCESSRLLRADSEDLDLAVAADDAFASAERSAPPRRFSRRGLAAGAAAVVAAALASAATLAASQGAERGVAGPAAVHGALTELAIVDEAESGHCHDALEGEPCFYSVNWARDEGIFAHPEWYKGLSTDSKFGEFQLSLYKAGAKNCSSSKPCDADAMEKKLESAKSAAEAAEKEAVANAPPPGPRERTFYMYRAQSAASYPLENINTADLAGVFWYLHNEVIVATPRKYKIDRIKRFKVTVKNTWEFWNAHHRQFGAFVAYDAGGCTTPVCKDVYKQYGFIVGCQVQPLTVAGYLGRNQTNWQCKAGEDACRAPIWYSLPGPCPAKGIPNGKIDPDKVGLDVDSFKTPSCVKQNPGGHCGAGQATPSGSPDCTYTYEDAGEVFLDDLVGIKDYNDFWNASYTRCADGRADGTLPHDTECRHKKEYDPQADRGFGTDFWDGMHDKDNCTSRMDKARSLFKDNFPQFPEHLEEPACEFDMYYDGEFEWKINHTGSTHSDWWTQRTE